MGVELTNPDYVRFAESFGIRGYAPKTPQELESVLSRVVPAQEMCIVEVQVDPSVDRQLTAKLSAHGGL
jgi:acetolactate synthase-1/2/3 large subunit